MKKIVILILLIQISGLSFGQQTFRTPEYGKTLYNLFSLNHKAVSYPQEVPPEITIQDLKSRVNKEDVVVYIVYEMNSEFKRNDGSRTIQNNKLMEFYIVYDYSYKLFYSSQEKLANDIPSIKLDDGCTISKVTIKNYFINEKGKMDNIQLKKSAFKIENDKGLLSINIESKVLVDSSLLEIHVKVFSNKFYKLQPSISNIGSYEKHLIVSFPTIFNYKIPTYNNYLLSSHTTSSFELLNFMHTSGLRNGNIEKVKSVSEIYSWEIKNQGTTDFTPEFELDGIKFIPNVDIGIMGNEILNIE